MIGDADQTIFEFAGANCTLLSTLYLKDAKQLEDGHRCGKTINDICKDTIKPIWDHYGYERIWRPANT